MDLLRRNRLATVLVAAVAVLVVVAALSFLRGGKTSGGTVIGSPADLGSQAGQDVVGGTSDGSHARGRRAGAQGGFAGLPTGSALPALGSVDLPGLPGTGFSASLPKIPIVLRVTSSAPIGTVGYLVPTSPNRYYGVVKGVGRSWQLRTYGYGKPDYARIFVQSGPTGAVITCTVTVRGRVTDERSTSGPYGRTMCQG